MDKYENKVRLDEIKQLVGEKRYDHAADLCDEVNWRKVKNINSLIQAGEAYTQVGRYDDAREVLLTAYDRSPIGRMIIYRLAEIAIRTKNFEEAQEYYDEFVDIAPHDNLRYVLRYEMMKAEGAPLEERIALLEEFKEEEYTEQWAFELAYLYHKAGESEKCIDACDELVLWFGDGPYVEKALELKMLYQPLNKIQEQKYRDFRMKNRGAVNYVEIHATDRLRGGEVASQTVTIPDISVDMEKYNTVNLQKELAKSMEQIANATEKETVSDTMDMIKKMVEEIPYLQLEPEEEEQEAKEEEKEKLVEEEKKIDQEITQNFENFLAEEYDGQMSLKMEGTPAPVRQITGQLSIDEILAEWEMTQRAAEAALADANQKKLEVERARALQEAEDIMKRLSEMIPQLEAGMTPKAILEEKYTQDLKNLAEQDERTASELVANVNDILQQEIDRLTGAGGSAGSFAPEELPEISAPEELPKLDYPEDMSAQNSPEPISQEMETEEGAFEQPVDEAVTGMAQPVYEEITEEPQPETEAAENEAPRHERATLEELAKLETAKLPDLKTAELPSIDLLEEVLKEQQEKEEPKKWVPRNIEDVEEAEEPAHEKKIVPFVPPVIHLDKPEQAVSGEGEKGEIESGQAADKADSTEEAAGGEDSMPDLSITLDTAALPEIAMDGLLDEPEPQEEKGAAVEQGIGSEAAAEDKVSDPVIRDKKPKEENAPVKAETEKAEQGDPEAASPETRDEAEPKLEKESVPPKTSPKEKMLEGRPKALTDEEREIFSYFVAVDGMESQITGALHRTAKKIVTPAQHSGHILIASAHGNGKTAFATDFVKVLQKRSGRKLGNVGRIEANALNHKDVAALLKKVKGGVLIIENAGDLNNDTVSKLSLNLQSDQTGLLIIMEDTKEDLDRVLSLDSSFAEKFTEKIEIPAFSMDELVEFAKAYAAEQYYEIDEMAILALYDRITQIERLDKATSLAEVKEIVDDAIARAERITLRNLFSSKKSEDGEYTLLREKDFT